MEIEIPLFIARIQKSLEDDYEIEKLKLRYDEGHFIFQFKEETDGKLEDGKHSTRYQEYVVEIFKLGDAEWEKHSPMFTDRCSCDNCKKVTDKDKVAPSS